MEVDFEAGTADVTMAPGKTLTRDDCEKALTGTKYKVTDFKAGS